MLYIYIMYCMYVYIFIYTCAYGYTYAYGAFFFCFVNGFFFVFVQVENVTEADENQLASFGIELLVPLNRFWILIGTLFGAKKFLNLQNLGISSMSCDDSFKVCVVYYFNLPFISPSNPLPLPSSSTHLNPYSSHSHSHILIPPPPHARMHTPSYL